MAEHLESSAHDGLSGPQAKVPAAIPDHALLGLIGRGSYGEIWLARNTLGSYRAVKIVHASTFRDKRPFERELSGVQKFEPVSRLHEGLVDILQVGRNPEAGYFYCVMELADDVAAGQAISPDHYTPRTLAWQIAQDKRVPIDICLQVGSTICSALAFLHSRGLIHRDVKPSNIVFVQGVPKLADIGLVVEMAEARSYVGTEGFIPPEGPGTVQADLYSLGKVLYEMSTGKDRHDYPELPTLLDETTPSRQLLGLNKVILKACRTDPRERYRSAAEMLADLQALQRGEPLPPSAPWRRSFWLASATGSLLVAASLLFVWFGKRTSAPEILSFPQGLVSWWHAEGNGLDALHPEVQPWLNRVGFAAGRVGKAFSVDGNKGLLELTNVSFLQLTNEVTIEFWIKRQQLTLPDYVVEKGNDWTSGELNYAVAVNNEEVGYSLLFAFACGYRGAGRIADLNWHHCAVVARNGQADPTFYIDGVEQPVIYRGGEATVKLYPSTEPLHIGAQSDARGHYNYFSPKLIDELAIYDRALSAPEIQVRACGCDLPTPRPVPAVAAPASSHAPLPAPLGLVSWWRAEGDAKDAVGTNHGLLMGNVSFVEGKVGQGFLLNGTNSYIRVPHSPSLNLTNEFTIEMWFQDFSRLRYNYGLIAKRGSESAPISFDLCGCTASVAILFNDLSVSDGENPLSDFEVSYWPGWPEALVWHHVAAIYQQTDSEHVELKLFMDGQLVKTGKHRGNLANSLNPYPVTIGADAEYPSYDFFEGIIDEVTLYNRALSHTEIEEIYRAGSAGKCLVPRQTAAAFKPHPR